MKSLIVTITAACALFSASYALADGPPAKTPPPKAAAAQHEMCSGMMGGKMPAGKGQMGGMKGPDGKPMSKAEMDKMHKMCGEMMMGHGGMGQPKAGAHPPAGSPTTPPMAGKPSAHDDM